MPDLAAGRRPLRLDPRPARPIVQRVVVIDTDPILRAGWNAVLAAQPWVTCCRAVASVEAAVEEIGLVDADAALVGLLPDHQTGMDACRRLREAFPALRILLVSDGEAVPRRAARAVGAAGLVQRDWPLEHIIAAVRQATSLDAPVRDVGAAAVQRLSRRERTVLSMLARGASNVEIAAALHLSHHTVKEYTQSVFRKLGVRNRVEAARTAALLGYAD